MKLIHIAPINLIEFVDKEYNKGLNMVLTHLVLENKDYRDAFKRVKGEKYLDNSFFELGYCMEPTEMIKAAEMVDATVLICPDGTKDGIELFKGKGYKVMCIPKTPAQFVEFMWDTGIDLVGVSEEHLAYRHSPGARYELFRDHLTRDMPMKKIHLLGATDSAWELGLLSPFSDHIRSWDSSAAIWQGHLSNTIKDQVRKDCTPVDFDVKVRFDHAIEANINFLESLV